MGVSMDQISKRWLRVANVYFDGIQYESMTVSILNTTWSVEFDRKGKEKTLVT